MNSRRCSSKERLLEGDARFCHDKNNNPKKKKKKAFFFVDFVSLILEKEKIHLIDGFL